MERTNNNAIEDTGQDIGQYVGQNIGQVVGRVVGQDAGQDLSQIVDENASERIDIDARTEAIRGAVKAAGAGALLLTCLGNVFYATGTVFNGYYYLSEDGEPICFVKKSGAWGLDNAEHIRKPEQITKILAERGFETPATMLVEDGQIPYSEALRLQKAFPNTVLLPASQMMREVRSVKTPYELSRIIKGANMAANIFNTVPSLYKKGMTDNELWIEIDYLLKRRGHLGFIRQFSRYFEGNGSSIISGPNAINPSPYDYAVGGAGVGKALPAGANGTVMTEGSTVLVDFATNLDGYLSDTSRTFSVGKTPDSALAAHEVAITIQDMIVKYAKPSAVCGEIYEKAVKMAEESGYGDYFMGYKQKSRFVGHGVGIELDEMPVLAHRSKTVLKEGMVIAIEPKFTLPGIGAVGVENTCVVRRDGLEKLAPSLDDKIVSLQ